MWSLLSIPRHSLQCSTSWAIMSTGSGSLCEFMVTRERCTIYFKVDVQYISKSYNWTAESETSWTWSSQFWKVFNVLNAISMGRGDLKISVLDGILTLASAKPIQSVEWSTSWAMRSTGSWSLSAVMITLRKQDCHDHTFTVIPMASNRTLSACVTGLWKFTEYELFLLAFTANGNGPLTPVKLVRTSEEVRCQRQ